MGEDKRYQFWAESPRTVSNDASTAAVVTAEMRVGRREEIHMGDVYGGWR